MTSTQFKNWRKKLGLTQQKTAELLSVHIQTVKKWEYGERKISKSTEKLIMLVGKQLK